MHHFTRRSLLIAAAAALSLPAQAQSWPQRPVTVVVPQAAGNSPDVLCRVITERLSRALGQQFVVENRPGAANLIGTQAVARAAPDGYSFLFATSAALATNPYTFKTLPYDPVHDFAPVSMVAKSNHVLLVNPTVKASTLPDLIKLEKSAPGSMSMAVDGPRNLSGILGQYINKVAGTSFVMVPYNTISNAIQDTIAGRTAVTIQSASVAEPHIKEGTLRPLAVAGSRRIAAFPDVPAISESLPAVELQGWFMVLAPAKTAPEITERLSAAIREILNDQEVQRTATNLGFEIEQNGPVTPAAAEEFLRKELALSGKIIREIGIEPQ
jgi:tripartite-type tricarboxylate transporter receptor subunit TctC